MSGSASLWGNIALPQWTDASPERLYALFTRHQAGKLVGRDRDEYARLLMVVVAHSFGRHDFPQSLRRARLDPQEVAQEALAHLLRKIGSGRMRLKHPCWRVMLSVLNTSIYLFVLTALKLGKRQCREIVATDYHARAEDSANELTCARAAPVRAAVTDRDILRDVWASEDRVIGDIVIRHPLTPGAVERLFRHLCRELSTRNAIPTHAELPASLQREVSLALHGLVTFRINRLLLESTTPAR